MKGRRDCKSENTRLITDEGKMEEAEKLERLKIMLYNAKTLSKAGDPLFDHYLPGVTVALVALLRVVDPHNPEFDHHCCEFE